MKSLGMRSLEDLYGVKSLILLPDLDFVYQEIIQINSTVIIIVICQKLSTQLSEFIVNFLYEEIDFA